MNKKKRKGVVFSTDPDFEYSYENKEEEESIAAEEQLLYVSLDKKQRKGKKVTLIQNFRGKAADLESLAKELKTKCGAGGSVKDREIIIQGDFREKVTSYLLEKGYKVKRKGG